MNTALVIEDHPDNMILICDILDLNGYATLQAVDGMQGYALAQEKQPDFIILDIQLPDINGYQVLEKIRSNWQTKNTPVIAMTSYAMAGEENRLLNAGCDGYVEKPIDPGRVMEQILQAIEKKA
ncbi:MAG: two-component system cell cycle response regulator DivK [Paraglaciecola sp.]|jgi:two-component system cell cycle response regulator DivK